VFCIPVYSQQCGCGRVFLSTNSSVGMGVYLFPPHAVWMWISFPPQHCRRAGCIPFHRLQCRCAGCIPFYRGRAGCIQTTPSAMWTCRLYSYSPPAVLTCRAIIILVRTPTGIPRYLRYAASASQITQPLSFMSNQRKNLLLNKQLNFQPYNSKVVSLVRLAGRF